MDAIRPATKEEVESIKDKSDLQGAAVWAMGKDLAVIRECVEVDPVFFAPETNDSRKLVFIWGIENMLRVLGHPRFYFNIPAGEETEKWRKVVENFGAVAQSPSPEIRFKKVL